MTPDHYTPKQAAAALYLKSAGTLANWRVEGKGPKWIKHGRRVLYPIAAVEDYIRGNFLEPERSADRKPVDLVPVAGE